MEIDQESYLFRPARPHQPVTVLLLIENSPAMSQHWPYLRDNCLDRLAANLEHANNSALITASVLESYPCQSPRPNPFLLRQCPSGLREAINSVQFNPIPENKISVGHISSCIDSLDQQSFRVSLPALHLIIVAANTPSDGDYGFPCAENGYSSPWLYLAKEMGTKNIHCHLVVSPQNDMGSLTLLFEETLRMQGNAEEYLHPPTDPTKVMLRLSARPNYDHQQDMRTSNSFAGGRAGLPQRNSYPLPDNFHSEIFDETGAPLSNEADQPQSLVSQLQQYHGLTKKKVYGTKPTRQPFFRDERVEKHRQLPAPLIMPLPVMNSVPSPTGGGRTISHSRVDRMNRVSQASPTDMHRRQHSGWPRRGSRMSTPEADHSWSSPSIHTDMSPGGSYIASDLSSTVIPIVPIDDVYGHPAAVTSIPPPPTHVMPGTSAYAAAGRAEGNWTTPSMQPPQGPQQYVGPYTPGLQSYIRADVPQYGYPDNSQLSFPVERMTGTMPAPSETTRPLSLASRAAHPPMSLSPPSIVPSQAHHVPPVRDPSLQPPAQIERSAPTGANNVSRTAASNRKTIEDDNEERFSFSEEFVAATAMLFNAEVLPAYPDYPGSTSGLLSTSASQQLLPSLPVPQAGELYASRDQSYIASRMNSNSETGLASRSQGHVRATPYVPTSASTINNDAPMYAFGAPHYGAPNYGSSLTGWAG